jgi:hypothetical protein
MPTCDQGVSWELPSTVNFGSSITSSTCTSGLEGSIADAICFGERLRARLRNVVTFAREVRQAQQAICRKQWVQFAALKTLAGMGRGPST